MGAAVESSSRASFIIETTVSIMLSSIFMTRTANPERPVELQEAIVRNLLHHGIAGLSLRPLAKAVGSSPRVLLYYFGSKELLVAKVLADIRERQRAAFGKITAASFGDICWSIWRKMSARESEPLFRLFFEAYGLALRDPGRYKTFLQATVRDWLELIAESLENQHRTRNETEALATMILAGLRGFMLDYCATHDRKRLDRAVRIWATSIDRELVAEKEC